MPGKYRAYTRQHDYRSRGDRGSSLAQAAGTQTQVSDITVAGRGVPSLRLVMTESPRRVSRAKLAHPARRLGGRGSLPRRSGRGGAREDGELVLPPSRPPHRLRRTGTVRGAKAGGAARDAPLAKMAAPSPPQHVQKRLRGNKGPHNPPLLKTEPTSGRPLPSKIQHIPTTFQPSSPVNKSPSSP